MKKIQVLLLFVFSHFGAAASHGMGGEITWTCNGTQYVFQMKFYRDCNGIPGPQNTTLSTNVVGTPTIPLVKISQIDISPVGSHSSGLDSCKTCAGASGGTPGVVEEFIYESAPVTLAGVPPAGGWTFWWYSCCRSGALTNVSGGGGYGFALRAKMFPFFGQIPGQCSDASPQFAERPSLTICTGYPFSYSPFAWDTERDSLNYSFDILLDDGGSPPVTPVPFAPGYSVSSQLPSTAQNPANVPATLNPNNGLISFTSYTQGYFATCIKVSSYKCGQLTAEIFREINMVLIGGCGIPVAPMAFNNPPDIDPPFADTSGTLAVYDTTVHAGDTLLFMLSASDADPHPVDTNQHITLFSASEQYGSGYTNAAAGCLIPPCATLTPPPPVTTQATVATQFNWITTTAHLGINFGCVYLGNVYYFLLKGTDNFCPANGQRVETMKITVIPNTPVPPVTNTGGTLTCLLFTGNYIYQWFLDRFAIPGATGQSYTPTTTGYYQVLAFDPLTGDGNYSNSIYVNVTGVTEWPGAESQILVFPNPTHNQSFTVSFLSQIGQDLTIRITDLAGREVHASAYHATQGEFKKEITLDVPAGIFTVTVSHKTGSHIKKLVLF